MVIRGESVKCMIGDTTKEVSKTLRKTIDRERLSLALEGWANTENDDDYANADVLKVLISTSDLHENLKIEVVFSNIGHFSHICQKLTLFVAQETKNYIRIQIRLVSIVCV